MKTKKQNKGIKKLVLIKWRDVVFYNGHKDINEIDNLLPEEYLTAGFLIKKDKYYVTLALTLREDGEGFTDVYKIPVGCIIKLKYLGDKDK